MEEGTGLIESDVVYPVLFIPKRCTTLKTNTEATDNVFIHLNITSPDVEGNEMCIYSGFCSVKLIETYDMNIQNIQSSGEIGSLSYIESEQSAAVINPETGNMNVYNEDEIECGVFLSQLAEEIMNKNENKAREERRYIDLQCDSSALTQLMSSDIQSASKQRKTILFLGDDSHCGQTIQKIAINDPSLECSSFDDKECFDDDDDIETSTPDNNKMENLHQKKYQCDMYELRPDIPKEIKFMCSECGKTIKTQEKYERHCSNHGNPELECNMCHKVFASKFTLRTHRKIHSRKYLCDHCSKTYSEINDLRSHLAKKHFIFLCDSCDFVGGKYAELLIHQDSSHPNGVIKESSETDFAESHIDVHENIITTSPENHVLKWKEPSDSTPRCNQEEITKADSVIAKVMSNEIFLLHSKRARKHKNYNKTCDVCSKMFNRMSDLKKHLIQHVVRSTLAKTPVDKNGNLNIQCDVCQVVTFNKVDRYKTHLGEHAKLTFYKCTFCDKSFSDASNFTKHRKTHVANYLQCDLCQRKFSSKNSFRKHIEYHNEHSPVQCCYCGKIFHFESMLNRHIKYAHTKEKRFKCTLCDVHEGTLKEKWDHEWRVHNIRKMIADCLICGTKFRKYSDLKIHCTNVHKMEIPPAKKFFFKSKSNKNFL